MPSRLIPRSPRAIVFAGFAAALLLGGAWLGRPFDAVREYDLETPAVPAPNAHDLYLAAATAIRRAPVSAVVDTEARPGEVKTYPLAAKIRWLKQNQPSFDLFERGLKAEYLLPPIREVQPRGDLFYPGQLNWLARCQRVAVEVLAEQNQPERAASKALDIWKMGLDMERGAHLTAALNAFSVESHARDALDPEIANLNGAEAARAAKRLETLLATRLPLAQTWREERAASLTQLKAKLEQAAFEKQRDEKNRAALERGENTFYYPDGPAPALRGPLVNFLVRQQAAQLASGLDFFLADAPNSWPKRQINPPEIPGLNPAFSPLMRAWSRARFFHARTDAQGQIFLARLALHAFRKDRDRYPETLQELAPKYLEKLPLDPFSDHQLLRYRREGKRYKLWSLGPDALDNGAKPAENPNPRRPNAKFLVVAESKGDIVANINK